MIKQTSRIYKIGEKTPPKDKTVLVYWKNGDVEVAPSVVLKTPHKDITHWAEVPPIESPFQRARRIVTEKA